MTAAFAPAPQTTFRPRTISEADRVSSGVPALALVAPPVEDVDRFATVHRLPVVHRDEVYRRRRLVVAAIVLALVLGAGSLFSSRDAAPSAVDAASESVTVVVQPGDTLWGIAAALDPSGDPRALVAQLTDLAGSASLQPGQELVVPGHWLG